MISKLCKKYAYSSEKNSFLLYNYNCRISLNNSLQQFSYFLKKKHSYSNNS